MKSLVSTLALACLIVGTFAIAGCGSHADSAGKMDTQKMGMEDKMMSDKMSDSKMDGKMADDKMTEEKKN